MEAILSGVLLICSTRTMQYVFGKRTLPRLPITVFMVGLALFSLSFMFATRTSGGFLAFWAVMAGVIVLYQIVIWRYTLGDRRAHHARSQSG